jgi:periplasmic protein TonB
MGYQALLFCPDEKMARVVGQVFSELDFAVECVHEPFAAVKKLMAQRYDAIVVDCENEQNASLLFKSARNSSSNQSSLAIALVEGQAGVAKAYRIGANLVLTKPINVEQAKGTLRVARGLLRKNSDAAGASSGAVPATSAKTTSVSAGSSFQPASQNAAATAPTPEAPVVPEFEAPLPETIPAGLPAMAASARVENEPAVIPTPAVQSKTTIAAAPAAEGGQPASPHVIKHDLVKNDVKNEAAKIAAASIPAQITSSAFTPAKGSAAAPAPAKEVTASPAKENKIVESAPAKPLPVNSSHDTAPAAMAKSGSVSISDAPSFGGLSEESSGKSGSGKKILIAVLVILALAAIGYLGYGRLDKSSTAPAPQPVRAPQASTQPAPALAPASSPAAAPSASTPDAASSTTQTSVPKTAPAAAIEKPSAGTGNSPAIRAAAKPEPATKKPDSTPILVKSNTAPAKAQAPAEESAPPLPDTLAVASGDDSKLSGLMSSAPSSLAKPTLATIRISQGVSQGLVIKRVQPKYPSAALAIHAEGAVQIEATIDKEGSVTNLKVLSGNSVLARAAVEAVRQWRYKPYYLNGQPVEIQTQITVNFKAN